MKNIFYSYGVICFLLVGIFQIFDTVLTCGEVTLYDIPDNATTINITACSGKRKITNRIVDQELTWSQALAYCKTMGFGSVGDDWPSWLSRTDVRNYLEDVNYKNLNYTFWVGVFRPRLHVRKWYSYRGACKEPPNRNPTGNLYNGQCSVIQRNESDFYHERILVEDCNKRYPFVCNKYLGCNGFLAYTGYDVIGSPLGTYKVDMFNVSLNMCKTECYNSKYCNSFSYDNASRNCTLYHRRNGYGAVNYTIFVYNTSNVAHYAKTGCIVEFMSNATNLAVSDDSPDLPSCGIDEVPQNYCPCKSDSQGETVANSDDIVNDLVKNLTIDRRSTSAYQRKLASSTDDREVSKAFGVFSIIVIFGTISLIVISDIFFHSCEKSFKKTKKK